MNQKINVFTGTSSGLIWPNGHHLARCKGARRISNVDGHTQSHVTRRFMRKAEHHLQNMAILLLNGSLKESEAKYDAFCGRAAKLGMRQQRATARLQDASGTLAVEGAKSSVLVQGIAKLVK